MENRPSSAHRNAARVLPEPVGRRPGVRASAMAATPVLYLGGRGECLTEPGRVAAPIWGARSQVVPHRPLCTGPRQIAIGCSVGTGCRGDPARRPVDLLAHRRVRLTEFWARMEQVLGAGYYVVVSGPRSRRTRWSNRRAGTATAMMRKSVWRAVVAICSFHPPFGERRVGVSAHRTGVRYSYHRWNTSRPFCRTASVASRRRRSGTDRKDPRDGSAKWQQERARTRQGARAGHRTDRQAVRQRVGHASW